MTFSDSYIKDEIRKYSVNVDSDKLKMHIVNPRAGVSHRAFCNDRKIFVPSLVVFLRANEHLKCG
jgi:hypothetical protein